MLKQRTAKNIARRSTQIEDKCFDNKTKKAQDKELLKLWGDVCKKRASNKCEYPECSVKATRLQAHHYFNRKNKSVRYDPMNAICLCAVHHVLGNDSAHLDPDFKEKWLCSGKRPLNWLDELTKRKNIIVKDNNDYRLEWLNRLKQELDKLYTE